MSKQVRAIRDQIQRVARSGEPRTRRYPEALRRSTVTYARERVDAGATVESVAHALGLAGQTLSYWLRSVEPDPATDPPAMRAVSVVPAPRHDEEPPAPPLSPASPVVITPQGLRIEGLDVAGISDLLRRLG